MKKKKYLYLSIVVFLILIVGISFAYLARTMSGTRKYVLTASGLKVFLDESKNLTDVIEGTNKLPIADYEGKQEEGYQFSIVNEENYSIAYSIYLVEEDTTTMPTYGLRYNLTMEEEGLDVTGNIDDLGGILHTTIIPANTTYNYTLKIWLGLDSGNDMKNTVYDAHIEVGVAKASDYADNSGANVPVLASGMIPVIYDEENKTWLKADIVKEWFDYDNQWWANAVTVTEATRSSYMSADPGTAISMADINTMWVWIPRYEYQYTDLGTSYAGGTQALPGEIKINFISKDQTVPSDSSVYKIPEGFTFGDEELSGFWMGKFETTGSISSACTSEECTTADLTIKPNLASVRSQTVSSFFYASRSMQNSTNASKYGFDVIGTGTMDTHMAKNTEWGIVAMLSQTKYGKYGNPNYSGANKEVYENKSSTYITGSSNGTPGQTTTNTQVTYDTPNTGTGASTTGTIYGVYDMSGASDEYVMGSYNNYSGDSLTSNSGFSGLNSDGTTTKGLDWPDPKYYDLYKSNVASDVYKNGDATFETSGWYNDYPTFVNSTRPWFIRGAYYNNPEGAGVFAMVNVAGSALSARSFRLILKP